MFHLNFFVFVIIVGFLGTFGQEIKDRDYFKHILHSSSQDGVSVYKVTLTTKSGIVKSNFESKVEILLKMIVKPYQNGTIYVKLVQEEGNAMNGHIYSSPHEEQFDRIETLQNLKNFEFLLTPNGKLILRKNETDINARKAMANILLFHWEELPEKPKTHYAHYQKTLYGYCLAMSSLKWEKELTVDLNYDPRNCYDFPKISFHTNDEGVYRVEGLHMRNNRKFQFISQNGKYFLKKLNSRQYIYSGSGKENTLDHFLYTFYDIELDEEANVTNGKESEEQFDFSTLHDVAIIPGALSFLVNENFNDIMSIPKDAIKKDEMYEEMQMHLKYLAELHEKYKELGPHTHLEFRNINKEITNTVEYMKYFTEEDILVIYGELMRDKMNGKMLEAFLEILPLVGTPATTIIATKLIMDPKIDLNRKKMLSKLTSNIRHVSFKSLDSLKNLTLSKDAPSGAFLAYSAALLVLSKKIPTEYDAAHSDPKVPLERSFLSINGAQYLDKAFDYFSQRLKTSNNYTEQVELIHSLGNLRQWKIFLLLKNYTTSNEDLLIHIMYAINKLPMSYQEYMDYFHDNFMRNASTEVRAVALSLIMNKFPTNLNYDMIARRLYDEKDYELYNIFVSSARILIEEEVLPRNILTLLQRIEPTSRSRRFFFEPKGEDWDHIALGGCIIFDHKTKGLKQLRIDVLQKSPNGYKVISSLLLRTNDVVKISRINNIFEDLFEQKNFNFEVIHNTGYRTVSSTVSTFDFDSVKIFIQNMLNANFHEALAPYDVSRFDIFSLGHFEQFFPTDSGNYARIYEQISAVTDFNLKTQSSKEENKKILGFNFSFNATVQKVVGMEMMQPLLAAFQGTKEISSLHVSKQLGLDNFDNPNKIDYHNFFVAKNKKTDPKFELKYRKDTAVYFNHLKKPNITSEHSVPIAVRVIDWRKSTYLMKNVLAKGDWSDLGLSYNVEILRCQAPTSGCTLPTSMPDLMNMKPFSDMINVSSGDFLAALLNRLIKSFSIPSIYGVEWSAVVRTSEIFDVAKIGLLIKRATGEVSLQITDSTDNVVIKYMFSEEDDEYKIARIAEGPTTALCLKFNLFYREMPEWTLRISYGQYNEKTIKCPRFQTQINIEGASNFNGEQLELHNNKAVTYAQCRPASEILESEEAETTAENSYTCAKAATMFRDLVIWGNYKNIPPEAVDFVRTIGLWMFSNTDSFRKAADGVKSSGTFDIGIYRPMHSDEEYEMTISTADDTFEIRGSSMWFHIENSAFQGFNFLMENFFVKQNCRIYAKDLPQNVTHWTLLGQINYNDHLVFAQRFGEDQLSLRFNSINQEIRISPKTDEAGYSIMMSDSDADSMPMYTTRNHLSTITVGHTVFVLGQYLWKNYNSVIGYNGKSILITSSRLIFSHHCEWV